MKLRVLLGVFVIGALFSIWSITGWSIPIVSLPTNLFEAAVGQIRIPILRLWQSRGGFSRATTIGSTSTDTLLIQASLSTDPNIYPQGLITGYFGKETQDAILNFQKEYNLPITGIFDKQTREALNTVFLSELCPTNIPPQQDLSSSRITRSTGIPLSYIPSDLVDISKEIQTRGIVCVKKDIVPALQNLFKAASADGLNLSVCSGYRKSNIQEYLMVLYGKNSEDSLAQPGHSEHQLGTTVDISGSSIGYACADKSFIHSPESDWLIKNAWRYGFNLSYPSTQNEYIYEPWHWRYVGVPMATKLHSSGSSYIDRDATLTAPEEVSTTTIYY